MAEATDTKKKAEKPMPELKVHPSADLFPMLSDAELDTLAKSIKDNGLREKIVVDHNGVIIDGRNRYEALKRAGIPLKVSHLDVRNFETAYDVDNYIVMANLERRMLTREQRKELAGKLAIRIEKDQAERPKEVKIDSTAKAAELAGVSRRTAADAKKEALVAIGLREPTPMNPPKKAGTAKPDQAPARPPAVVKSLESVRGNIYATGEKWPENRKQDAVRLAFDILNKFATTAFSYGMPDNLAGLFGVQKNMTVSGREATRSAKLKAVEDKEGGA